MNTNSLNFANIEKKTILQINPVTVKRNGHHSTHDTAWVRILVGTMLYYVHT